MSRHRPTGTGRRCATPGCRRFVAPNRALCPPHGRTRRGRDLETALQRVATDVVGTIAHDDPATDDADRRRRAARRFREHLATGDLEHLLDARLGRLLAHAAEERDLAAEHGALRLVLHRLITDEDDPSRLAAGVARLAHATARISQARRALAADAPDEFTAALHHVLMEINRPPDDAPRDQSDLSPTPALDNEHAF